MWSVFGGQPLRFSLNEFAAVTSLCCDEYPEGYDPEKNVKVGSLSYAYWDKLIGLPRTATIADISAMMKATPDMPAWRRLRLALLLIVDGVLIATHQVHKPTLKYVNMLEYIESFLKFPWGRESFLKTVTSVRPGTKITKQYSDQVVAVQQRLKQGSVSVNEFPLTLQLVAFCLIPELLTKLPNSSLEPTLMTAKFVGYAKLTTFSRETVLETEFSPNLVVVPKIDHVGDNFCNAWDRDLKDSKLLYLEELVDSGHVFTKSQWHGGDDSEVLSDHTTKPPVMVHKKHVLSTKPAGLMGGEQSPEIQKNVSEKGQTSGGYGREDGNNYLDKEDEVDCGQATVDEVNPSEEDDDGQAAMDEVNPSEVLLTIQEDEDGQAAVEEVNPSELNNGGSEALENVSDEARTDDGLEKSIGVAVNIGEGQEAVENESVLQEFVVEEDNIDPKVTGENVGFNKTDSEAAENESEEMIHEKGFVAGEDSNIQKLTGEHVKLDRSHEQPAVDESEKVVPEKVP
ncbi:hypothetical protein AALP_AA8G267400 [Arabis alpina]|uniref:DUF1985 domain-containing protein n=1 Tax=Arabis alpina TaxID=50452 RepID=A0A087G9N2_ARAAL|nr:hypothetical protein AALP_AA8G267400 [Arabis alpina]